MPIRCGLFHATLVVVNKSRRELLLLHGDSLLRSYRIALGPNPSGAKTHEGDGKTPEGRYIIDRRNPRSAYHLALHISYPNSADRDRSRALGLDPGGDVMIHGRPNGSARGTGFEADWTQGCIAVADEEMDEIWNLVADGTPIQINP